jgi:8-oxo-dGTP pyrophosphatase MutT (NUDIX family)
MKDVHCYGVIPLRQQNGQWEVLLIKHNRGSYWSFPKGHGEAGETSYQSASRELREETGLSVVRYLSDESVVEHYNFIAKGEQVHKTVTYYLAEVEGELVLQKEEIMDARWEPFSLAETFITFKEGKSLCRRAVALLDQGAKDDN